MRAGDSAVSWLSVGERRKESGVDGDRPAPWPLGVRGAASGAVTLLGRSLAQRQLRHPTGGCTLRDTTCLGDLQTPLEQPQTCGSHTITVGQQVHAEEQLEVLEQHRRDSREKET